MTMWDTIAAERAALADDLEGLDADRWDTPSWCAGWSVREVLAHMTSTAVLTPAAFAKAMLRARFRFARMAQAGLEAQLGPWPDDTLRRFRSVVDSTTAPPGPKLSWLGEAIVHAEDIRRPLGITHAYPTDAVQQVLDFYAGSNMLIGTKARIDGLHLLASDTAYSHGAGGRVEGPLISLLMAATGRVLACDDLAGPGVAILRGRCLAPR